MSFTSMHNDYLDPDRHLWPEDTSEATMTSIAAILDSVERNPGQTAHWHNVNAGRPVRQSWCYAAFKRAVKAGRIRFETKGCYTVYYAV